MLKAGIAGGSGYGGLELIGVLLRHPGIEIVSISSEKHAGKEVCQLYPHLRGILRLAFAPLEETLKAGIDVLFLALPHGEVKVFALKVVVLQLV